MSLDLPHPEDEAALLFAGGSATMHIRFVLAVLGVLPWVGSLVAASAALHAEREQQGVNALFRRWHEEHEAKLAELQRSLERVIARVESLGDSARERLNDERFLPLVRRAYRGWDEAQTEEKRRLFERLLTNAAGTRLVDDDVVRLFVDWIDRYDEAHFRIIEAVFHHPGITRLGIWQTIGRVGPLPAENSSDADLFRMLMHDLSTGRVVRQHRETDVDGNFLRKRTGGARSRGSSSPYMKSSFSDTEGYELTVLGSKFVHYVLSDAVGRIGPGE